jgi:hypothetical protein
LSWIISDIEGREIHWHNGQNGGRCKPSFSSKLSKRCRPFRLVTSTSQMSGSCDRFRRRSMCNLTRLLRSISNACGRGEVRARNKILSNPVWHSMYPFKCDFRLFK